MTRHYKDLIVWRKAMDLVFSGYDCTQGLQHEVYSLTDQMRRAAVSVPSNIAEGQAHFSNREFLHFLRHSSGSLAELETQLLVAERVGYFAERKSSELLRSIQDVGRLRHGLMNSLNVRTSA